MKINSTKTTTRLACIAGFALTASMANAAVIAVDTTYGFTTTNLAKLTDGSGITKGDPDDPNTWEVTAGNGAFADESFANPLVGATNNKLGWYAFDLGSEQDLSEVYVAMGRYLFGGSTLTLGSFNVYLAVTPTVSLANNADYNFASGGWTQIGGTTTFVSAGSDAVIDVSGNSARYVGIEIMSDFSTSDARTGMNEFAVTAIPEPSAALLGGLGLLALLRRRRS